MKNELKMFDALGEEWRWDGIRVYCVAAEEEMGEENGYPASTAREALEVLRDGGYMEKDNA